MLRLRRPLCRAAAAARRRLPSRCFSARPQPAEIAAHEAAALRRCWRPLLEPAGAAEDLLRSKFGGRPFLPADAEWPSCWKTGRPLLFLCQLDVPASPLRGMLTDVEAEHGLLQFFARADGRQVAYDPQGELFTRVVAASAGQPQGTVPADATLLPARMVQSWAQGEDEQPHPAEPEFEPSLDLADPAPGLKLGGWPSWVRSSPLHLLSWPSRKPSDAQIQSRDVPLCVHCEREGIASETSTLLLQLDGADDSVFAESFGDSGCGFIFQGNCSPAASRSCRDGLGHQHFKLTWQCC